MGRFREASDEESETAIDMSPLIDCVFILLIFFIVTTVFVEETSVEIDKPRAASASDLEKNSILIAITSEGDVVYDKKNIGTMGVEDVVGPLIQQEPEMPVIIQPDKDARIEVLVRVIDEAKLMSATKVNLATALIEPVMSSPHDLEARQGAVTTGLALIATLALFLLLPVINQIAEGEETVYDIDELETEFKEEEWKRWSRRRTSRRTRSPRSRRSPSWSWEPSRTSRSLSSS